MSRKNFQKFLLIFLILNLLINGINAACAICGLRGHNRRTCPNQFGAMIPYRNSVNNLAGAMIPYAQNNALIPQRGMVLSNNKFNIMDNWKVPWVTHMVVRTRPALGRACGRCGALGHTSRRCPHRAPRVVANVDRIRKSVKKYFENPTLKLSVCSCCGVIGHSQRHCQVYNAGGAGVGAANCIAAAQLNTIKEGYVPVSQYVPQPYFFINNVPKTPRIPRRPRIPNYIAACGCCGQENHNHNDPRCPFQNGRIRPCLDPRLIRSSRELRLWHAENNIPPNNGIGAPPPIPPRPPLGPPPLPPRPPNNNGGNNGNNDGNGNIIPIQNLQNQFQNLQNQLQTRDNNLFNLLIRQSNRINQNIQNQNAKTNEYIFNRFNNLNQRMINIASRFDNHKQNLNNGINRIKVNIDGINNRFNNLEQNMNNNFNNIGKQIDTRLTNFNQRFDRNENNINNRLNEIRQTTNNGFNDLGTQIEQIGQITNERLENIHNSNQNIGKSINALEQRLNNLNLGIRTNIQNFITEQLNAHQREMIQRFIGSHQPKRISINHRRAINFRSQRRPVRQITTGNIMGGLQIHSQSGSSLGEAQYNPESSGSITYRTEKSLGKCTAPGIDETIERTQGITRNTYTAESNRRIQERQEEGSRNVRIRTVSPINEETSIKMNITPSGSRSSSFLNLPNFFKRE
ncbi:4054_t:CDS:2 [Cetraspora pellucida]|uniref:4054_t:CDS:1 n=1 Tax=Cetraspora pellucida TaxID=1433469 RepID=A0A9N9BUU2_9GLOM|nr:4054_t:CDS:2 [Cetraspora pellucida]